MPEFLLEPDDYKKWIKVQTAVKVGLGYFCVCFSSFCNKDHMLSVSPLKTNGTSLWTVSIPTAVVSDCINLSTCMRLKFKLTPTFTPFSPIFSLPLLLRLLIPLINFQQICFLKIELILLLSTGFTIFKKKYPMCYLSVLIAAFNSCQFRIVLIPEIAGNCKWF